VLALSVTPGYFNPPHFWIWTGPDISMMHYALCTMHYALCTMHYALCTMHSPAVTHCFLEIHLWEVVVDIFTVVLVGKLIGDIPTTALLHSTALHCTVCFTALHCTALCSEVCTVSVYCTRYSTLSPFSANYCIAPILPPRAAVGRPRDDDIFLHYQHG
jgi:hypothetical protein